MNVTEAINVTDSCDLSSTCRPVDCGEDCTITDASGCISSDVLYFNNDGVITLNTEIDVDAIVINTTCVITGSGGIR